MGYGDMYFTPQTEPAFVDVLVHDHDEDECELSTHPGDAMDNVCIHGHRLRMVTRDW